MTFDFDEWCEKFRHAGYEVTTKALEGVRVAFVNGRGIRGAFGEPPQWYKNLDGRFAADHVDCFDKWSKCPLVVKLPCDFKTLEKNLDYLSSDTGYELSDTYAYLDNNPLPYEVE